MTFSARLKLWSHIIKFVSGIFVTTGGLAGMTGYGLSLPFFYRLGGSQISLLAATFFTVIGLSLILTGAAGWLDCSHPRLERLKEILRLEIKEKKSKLPPEGTAAAKRLLGIVEKLPDE